MPNHPNRSRVGSPSRNPTPAEVIALREELRRRRSMGITEAQDWCAAALHTSTRAFQQWEHGDRRMHPTFWELLRIKVNGHSPETVETKAL